MTIADAQSTYFERIKGLSYAHHLEFLYLAPKSDGQPAKFVDVSIAFAATTAVQGYFIVPLLRDAVGDLYAEEPSKFAYVAYPETYGTTGELTYIVDQAGQVYQRDLAGRPVTQWPTEASLKRNEWSATKMGAQ